MKSTKYLLLPLMLLGICGCDNTSTSNSQTSNVVDIEEQTEFVVPFTNATSDEGKAMLLNRNGVPQIIISSLLRTDLFINADFKDASEMEKYFALAKETNMNTIELSIMWSRIERSYDNYDFSDLEHYLNFAKKYDLKINIEWYGSFVDGETHMANVPSYIDDSSTYPVIQDMFDYANYGRCKILDWSNSNLLTRETKAVYNMMNYIYDWNVINDNYDPVIMVQVGQGVDRFQRWRVQAYDVKDSNGETMTSERAWSLAKTYLNEVARGVKISKYRAITRAEFCEQNAVVNYVRDIKDLGYIDIVSPTYLHEISLTKNGIKSFADEYKDMFLMNAENWASDINHKQTLATFAMGASGYVSYQLSCPLYFPESPNGALYARFDESQTTLQAQFKEKNTRASDTKAINKALLDAFVPVANAPRSRFASFGLNNLLNNKDGNERIQRIYMNNGLMLSYSNPKDSLGFAISDGNYLYAYSSSDATLDIDNCTITMAQSGSFDKLGDWNLTSSMTLENNKRLNMKGGQVYRIRIASINDLPSASSLKADGYLSTLDSIRG